MKSPDYEALFNKAYTQALKFLSYRPRSEKEVARFLAKKKFESLIIENLIKLLKEQNFLNDEEFAKWWVEQRQTHRAKGKILIKNELRQKGIAEEMIEKALEEAKGDYETAKELLTRKKRQFEKYTGDEYFQKTASFLQRRGFSWETIKKILRERD